MEIKDEERMATIPLIAHELDMARMWNIVKVLFVIIALLIGVIAYDAYQDSCYDYSDITVDGNDGSNATYMGAGASGVINNGQNSSQEKSQEE